MDRLVCQAPQASGRTLSLLPSVDSTIATSVFLGLVQEHRLGGDLVGLGGDPWHR